MLPFGWKCYIQYFLHISEIGTHRIVFFLLFKKIIIEKADGLKILKKWQRAVQTISWLLSSFLNSFKEREIFYQYFAMDINGQRIPEPIQRS